MVVQRWARPLFLSSNRCVGFPASCFFRPRITLIFRDQLWASPFSTLDFKQPLHQVGVVFHDFLQGRPRLVGWQEY